MVLAVTGIALADTPTNLAATPAAAADMHLSWTAPSGTISGYNVYRGQSAGAESTTALNGNTPLANSATTFDDTTVVADSLKEYQDVGGVRHDYVDQIYSARVTYVTDTNTAEETFSTASGSNDSTLTSNLAQSDYLHQKDLTTADYNNTVAIENQQVTYQQALSAADVTDAAGRARAEQIYQTAIAQQQYQAAASAASAQPSNVDLQVAAATADAFFAWIGALSTVAAGQSDSPYVLFRMGEAQAEAQSENGLAVAQENLDVKQASASEAYAQSVAQYERDRTDGLAEVQDVSDEQAQVNQDDLALSTASNNHQLALDEVFDDASYVTANADATLRHDNGDISDDKLAQLLRDNQYTHDTAIALDEFNWRDRAAGAERDFAKAEANRNADALASQASSQTEAIFEETYSLGTALAQQTQDLALAAAQSQNMLDQTGADNAQRSLDAAANAAFLTAQYAAKVPATQVLAADLSNTPWAQYQEVRALAEQAAWTGTLDSAYLIWQGQVSGAYTSYTLARMNAYLASANDIANRTYADGQSSARRTAQEVGTLSGDEQSFETWLAGRVYSYREAMATADRTDADGLATAAHDGTSYTSTLQSDQQAAGSSYQSDYVARDGQRRHSMAQASLSFVSDLASAAESAAAFIAADQAGFDTAAANAYYVAGTVPAPSAGLEFTLASLANTYAVNYANTFTTALVNLENTGVGSSAPWASWAIRAALNSQTHLRTIDIPSANFDFAARLSQAVSDNVANLSTGATDRGQWLSDLHGNDVQAISAAQAALTAANAGGNPGSVAVLGDLAPPSAAAGNSATADETLDLGSVNLDTPYYSAWKNAPLGSNWLNSFYADSHGNYTGEYDPGWGKPSQFDWVQQGSYISSTSVASGWEETGAGIQYPWQWQEGPGGQPTEPAQTYALQSLAGYGWWGDQGFAAPTSWAFDPFTQSGAVGNGAHQGTVASPSLDAYPNGFGATAVPSNAANFGLTYGAAYLQRSLSRAVTPRGAAFAWLPSYTLPAAPPTSVDPTAAVTQEQTAVESLASTISGIRDTLSESRDANAPMIDATSGAVYANSGSPYLDGAPSSDSTIEISSLVRAGETVLDVAKTISPQVISVLAAKGQLFVAAGYAETAIEGATGISPTNNSGGQGGPQYDAEQFIGLIDSEAPKASDSNPVPVTVSETGKLPAKQSEPASQEPGIPPDSLRAALADGELTVGKIENLVLADD
ncbi:MAG TPA: hypothetical protein VG056_13560, partial [Pirellulales bacterium]|nr:hypothetical protein [Pirellulales bacterium]